MKKFIIAMGAAAMMLGMYSCNGAGSSAGSDSSFGDSLCNALGQAQGMQLNQEYNMLDSLMKSRLNKQEIMKGFQSVCMADTNKQAYISGVQIGLQLYGRLMQYEKSGIKINRQKIYDAYSKAFLADSIPQAEMQKAQEELQALMQQADMKMQEFNTKQQEAARKAKMESKEGKANLAEGKAYIERMKKQYPDIKVTPSGLAYRVIEPGTGAPVGMDGQAKVQYKGTLVNGTTFDENAEGVTFRPSMVIPGFGEGLAMMKKGAHYVFYIPGDQAYGVDGTPDGKIGPNATLTFDVKTPEVTPGKGDTKAAAAPQGQQVQVVPAGGAQPAVPAEAAPPADKAVKATKKKGGK